VYLGEGTSEVTGHAAQQRRNKAQQHLHRQTHRHSFIEQTYKKQISIFEKRRVQSIIKCHHTFVVKRTFIGCNFRP